MECIGGISVGQVSGSFDHMQNLALICKTCNRLAALFKGDGGFEPRKAVKAVVR